MMLIVMVFQMTKTVTIQTQMLVQRTMMLIVMVYLTTKTVTIQIQMLGLTDNDADCDGVPDDQDCDSTNPNAGSTDNDVDCDGIPDDQDCDNTNSNAG